MGAISRWASLLLALSVIFAGSPMSDDHASAAAPSPEAFPLVPASESELLSARRLFLVKVLEVRASEWTNHDELLHRRLRLKLALVERLKGPLEERAGAIFEVEVSQESEAGGMTNSYHGFWSHRSPLHDGETVLVVSNGEAHAAAALMQEPAIVDLLGPEQAPDVAAARAAEAGFQRAGTPEAAVSGLFSVAFERRASLGGVFGRYAWGRTDPFYSRSEPAIRAQALRVALAPDTTTTLRQAMIKGLYDAAYNQVDPTPERRAALAAPLLHLIAEPQGAALADWMSQTVLYNLVFASSGPLHPSTVVPDPAERAKISTALGRLGSGRALELKTWVGG